MSYEKAAVIHLELRVESLEENYLSRYDWAKVADEIARELESDAHSEWTSQELYPPMVHVTEVEFEGDWVEGS